MHIRTTLFSLAMAALPVTAALAGCTPDEALPGGASVVRVGPGRLDYVAEENGQVYLFDVTTHKKIFAKLLLRGQQIQVDAALDRIVANGEVADHKPPLNSDHFYRLYFDRAL